MTYEELYRKHRKRIEGYIQFKLHSDIYTAEELTSDVFFLLQGKWERLNRRDENRLLSWLYNAALIKVREYIRKKPHLQTVSYDDLSNSMALAVEEHYSEETEEEKYQRYMHEIQSRLHSPIDLQTFDCFIVRRLNNSQSAQEMHITEVNAKVRLFRLRQKIKEILREIRDQM